MKTIIAVLVTAAFLWTGEATAQTFLNAPVHTRVQELDARIQALQLQQQVKMARQVEFLRQQQLAATNAVNVQAQLAELRALQQAQAFQAIQLNQAFVAQPQLVTQQVVQQPVVQQVVQQPVVQRQVFRQQVRQPVFRQRVIRQRVISQPVCGPGG